MKIEYYFVQGHGKFAIKLAKVQKVRLTVRFFFTFSFSAFQLNYHCVCNVNFDTIYTLYLLQVL